VIDHAEHVRAQDLDRHLMAAILGVQFREMYLRYGRAGDRNSVELGKHLAGRSAVGFIDLLQCQFGRERRNAILQLGKFVAMSRGRRSRRVDNTCPNLTKIGPSASSARRRRTERGASKRRQK